MRNLVIEKFKRGKWCQRSNSLLGDTKKVSSVLMLSAKYVKKEGLKEVCNDIGLLRDYIADIVKGRYKDYDKPMLTLSLAAIIYVISPFDFMPDFFPFGLLDDVSIVAWAVSQMTTELEKYKKRNQPVEQELENVEKQE